MERFPLQDSRRRFIDAARLMGTALNVPPKDMISLAANEQARSIHSPSRSTVSIVGDLAEEMSRNLGAEPIEGRAFFVGAMLDVKSIMSDLASSHRGLSDDDLLEVMSQPRTIDSLALLALRPDSKLQEYLLNWAGSAGELRHDGSYEVRDDQLAISNVGCPAAGFIATEHQEGAVEPLPIFKRLVPWAAEVNLLSREWREYRENQARLLSKSEPTSDII